ncbi:Thiamine pyrophosphate enzyme, central domain protein [uncultured delta proteobacterium]|uniref:Thiamine pyrophosphate enzyme, central domain protein n=1 Tax=uncultured delta proteobacterium TaxID=34034 RepID=A0A212KAB4_9DELT|nr:Thiamine pyrophosphate enzyme, central domain protein [uncultured delta proteobacterium]
MGKHADNIMADLLVDYGVEAVFGVPGGQTLPLYYGILDRGDRIRHVLMRDEINAAYAADAYARVSGKIGVCDATAGCGSIKFVSGLAEAYNSSIPVIAIASEMNHDWITVRYRGCGPQMTDSKGVLAPVTKWTATLPTTDTMAELVQRAAQMATGGRPGPVFIECPWKLFKDEYTGPEPKADPKLANLPSYRPVPGLEDIDAAIRLLLDAKRPLILAGGGCWLSGARDELTALAERTGTPVATTLSGKGILQENHPLSLGVLSGLGGNPASEKAAMQADLIFAVGFKSSANATFNWKLPLAGQRMIHLDIDPMELNKMRVADVAMLGDAKASLGVLLSRLPADCPKHDAAPAEALKKAWAKDRAEEAGEADPIRPQQVVSVLNEVCGDNTILVCDASFSCGWGGTFFDVYGKRRALFPRGNAGLGYGLPGGVGAAAARPDSTVVVLTGDGGLSYCLGEMATLREQGMNVKVVVLNNAILGWIKWYEAAIWKGRFTEVDTERVAFDQVARGLGCKGYALRNTATLRKDLAAVFAEKGPAVIDIATSELCACKFHDKEEAVQAMERSYRSKQG